MTKVKMLTLLCAALLVALSHAHARAAAQATQASLVKAWEEVQRNDPETVTFEKTGEGRYKFKTERFPFEGELKILKAGVNDYSYGGDDESDGAPNGYVVGVIEYDLVGLSAEVEKKYEHSYSNWQMNNTLYFDKEGGEWLSLDKYRAKMAAVTKKATDAQKQQQEQGSKSYNIWLSLAFWWGPVFLLMAFYVWYMKKTGIRRNREYMSMSLAHMQRSEELLERIAEAFEKQKGEESYARADAGEYRSQPPA